MRVARLALTLAVAAAVFSPTGGAARLAFDINGYIVGSWRNVDNQHVYAIAKAGGRYELRAGAAWATADGCQVGAGDLFYVLNPKQTTGGYLNGGDYVGPWRLLKKDDKGNCVWTDVQPLQQGYYTGESGFVPTTGAKTAENPDGQSMNWFCDYTHPYTQCAALSRIGKGFASGAAAGAPAKPVPVPAPAKLDTTAEYRAFLGLDDARIPDCSAARSRRAQELVRRARGFPGATSAATIPGEQHMAGVLGPGDLAQLYRLLAKTDVPQELGSNIYARATRQRRGALTYETLLRQKILSSPGSAGPADVLGYALEVTGGSYPLAVLTAHNLLKGVAVLGRNDIEQWSVAGPQVRPRLLADLREQSAVAGKLAGLRCDPATARDKLGPWYHAFAVLSAGALVDPAFAPLVATAEHGAKASATALGKLKALLGYALPKVVLDQFPQGFFKGEGGFDPEKAKLDAAVAAGALLLAPLSR